MESGAVSELQVRVKSLVHKLRTERFQQLLQFVQTFNSTQEGGAPLQAAKQKEWEKNLTCESCPEQSAEQLMSTNIAQALESLDEERGKNGSERPSELPMVGGSLVPPSVSHTPRNKSPVTVQEWVDSLPLTPSDINRTEEEGDPVAQDTDDNLTLGAEAGLMCGPLPPAVQVTSCEEPSESGSHSSSVDSLLEARKPDPEEVLLSLGFGGSHSSECRIPQRFLQPSRVKGVAVNDFLRHQHEMVQNFETGFCGYRGLSGPSHTMPSVIVAKIMEKLREHERESVLASLPPAASSNIDSNKFSRVAHHVLTKIKCVPGSSVLSPDNRKWLDSQGHKSPEIGRKRMIIGQQSFSFSNNGDLIESHSPPSSLTDSDSRWTSSTGTPVHHKPDTSADKVGFPSIQEDLAEPPIPSPIPRHTFANVVTTLLAEKNQEVKLSSSLVEEDRHRSRSAGDSGLPSSGRSSRGLDDCDSPINIDCATSDNHLDLIHEESKHLRNNTPSALLPLNDQIGDCKESSDVFFNHFKLDFDEPDQVRSSVESDEEGRNPEQPGDIHSVTNDEELRLESDLVGLKSSECTNSLTLNNSLDISLPIELTSSPCHNLASELETAQKQPSNNSRTNTMEQPEEPVHLCTDVSKTTLASNISSKDDALLCTPVKVIKSLDKVIESIEKIMKPLEVIKESDIHCDTAIRCQTDKGKSLCSYNDLKRLSVQLNDIGFTLDVGSLDDFIALTTDERCALQCRVVRQALSAYQTLLSRDTLHYQLKCCLGAEVLKLLDLLDTAANPDKLSALVRQVSELLKHQVALGSELHASEHEPHQLCELVLRRLRALELIVCRNTQALAHMQGHAHK